MKKWLIPVLCMLPFAGVALWFAAGKNFGNVATLGLVLACPLSHIFLGGHGKHTHTKKGGDTHET